MGKYLKHKFWLRGFDKHLELQMLVNQLINFGIDKDNIIIITNGIKLQSDFHKIIYLENNNGYQRGDIELLKECFKNSDDNYINHYINWGTIIFDFVILQQYLDFIDNTQHNIFLPKGYMLKNNEIYE